MYCIPLNDKSGVPLKINPENELKRQANQGHLENIVVPTEPYGAEENHVFFFLFFGCFVRHVFLVERTDDHSM